MVRVCFRSRRWDMEFSWQGKTQRLMRMAMTQLNFSACSCHRILKFTGTIADLAEFEEIESVHLAEALQ